MSFLISGNFSCLVASVISSFLYYFFLLLLVTKTNGFGNCCWLNNRSPSLISFIFLIIFLLSILGHLLDICLLTKFLHFSVVYFGVFQAAVDCLHVSGDSWFTCFYLEIKHWSYFSKVCQQVGFTFKLTGIEVDIKGYVQTPEDYVNVYSTFNVFREEHAGFFWLKVYQNGFGYKQQN